MNKESLIVFLDTTKPNTPFNNRYIGIKKMVETKYDVLYRKLQLSSNRIKLFRGFYNRLLVLNNIIYVKIKYGSHKKVAFYSGYIDPLTSIFIFFLSKIFAVKIICEINEFPVRVYKKNRDNIILRLIETNVADGYSLISDKLIEYYKQTQFRNIKMVKLPMTVDEERFEGISTNNNYNIVYCGSLNHKKDGLNFLLEAYKAVSLKSDLNLIIAGYGTNSEIDYLINFIEENNLKKRITYLGYLKSTEVPPLICSAKILVMPRPKSKQADGGFPSKLGEYLMTKKPIIVTRTGEIANYLSEDEIYFINSDEIVEELFKTILYIESNYEDSLRKAQLAYEKVMITFSLKANERNLHQFIKVVMG